MKRSCHGYQRASGERRILDIYNEGIYTINLFSKRVSGCQGDGFRAWAHEWVP